jgi:ribosomal protein S18 acetylase RimI-like enzyme
MSKTDIKVEQATLEQAVAIHSQIPEFDPSYIINNIDRPDLAIRDKKPHIVIARFEGKPAGYMISYDRTDTPGTMHIWLNGTIPQFRGHGIFKVLIDNVIDEAHARGDKNITVMSNPEHFPNMISALRASGFEITEQASNSIRFIKHIE